MRIIRIVLVSLFFVIGLAFMAFSFYSHTMQDHVPPQIVCNQERLEVSANATNKELCAGLTAMDDVDGDITDRILVGKVSQLTGANTAQVRYCVFDSSSNYCTFTREIYYTDYQMPRFSLKQPLVFPTGTTVALMDRLTAWDVVDGDISERIRLAKSTITTVQEGDYSLQLQVTNSFGDTSVIDLTVMLRNTTFRYPALELDEYIIYVPQNSDVRLEDFRKHIISAKESAIGMEIDPSRVEMTGAVDTETRGCYDVHFSYTNNSNLTSSVILTVVVE